MSYLITGGAGFIGSHLVDKLLKRGKKVIVIDNFSGSYDPNIKRNNLKPNLNNENFTLQELDLNDSKALKKVFDSHKITKVVHLAARGGVRASLSNPFGYEEANIRNTLNLLEISKEYDLESFVFASSSSVYGTTNKFPSSEEQSISRPASFYAATKSAGEAICYTYHHLYNIPIVCLRFFTIYGPRQRPDMAIYKFVRAISEGKEVTIYGDGSSKRDYTYISDIIKGIIQVLSQRFSFEVFNLGSSKVIELRKLISIIEDILGKKAKMTFLPPQLGDVPITWADISKAKRILGYQPQTTLKEGIEKFIKWYLNTGVEK